MSQHVNIPVGLLLVKIIGSILFHISFFYDNRFYQIDNSFSIKQVVLKNMYIHILLLILL